MNERDERDERDDRHAPDVPEALNRCYDALFVAPNTALDSFYRLMQLKVGEVNRAVEALHIAGGKGINAARAFQRLGGRGFNLGVVGGASGRHVVDELAREGLAHDMVWADPPTRRTSTLLDASTARTTVVLEAGQPVGETVWLELARRVRMRAPSASVVAFTGSLPPDVPTAFFANCIRDVRLLMQPDGLTCVDCTGDALRQSIAAGAQVVKVNWQEFRYTFGNMEWGDVPAEFARMVVHGVQILIVTDGARGAFVFAKDCEPLHVHTPVVHTLNTAGAGDTFLAAWLLQWVRGAALEQVARFASAAAASTLNSLGCGFVSLQDLPALLERTIVKALDVSALDTTLA